MKLARRKILSKVACVFDPIGFAAAFLIRAKIGLQRLWQQGFEWDEELPSEIAKWWNKFFKEIEDMNSVVSSKFDTIKYHRTTDTLYFC